MSTIGSNDLILEGLHDLRRVGGAGSSVEDAEQIEKRSFLQENGLEVSPDFLFRLVRLDRSRREITSSGQEIVYQGKFLGSHLFDSQEIFEAARKEFGNLAEASDIHKSALIHDIGKTGPLGADEETQDIIIYLFSIIHDLNPKDRTVGDLLHWLERHGSGNQQIRSCLKKTGVSPNMNLLYFYKKHVEWGTEILNAEKKLNPSIRWVATNHHRIRYGLDANIDGYEPSLIDRKNALRLELVDFIQAANFRRDSGAPNSKDLRDQLWLEIGSKVKGTELEACYNEVLENTRLISISSELNT